MIHIKKCTTLNFLLLVIIVALLLHKVTSTIYFVIPDDHSSHHMDTNTFSLQHYLNNTSKYFVSHNQFHFMQGQYYINNDLVIKDVDNFTITGIGQCTIICTSPASIVMMNANNTKILNINLINCTKKVHFNITSFSPFSKITDYYTSLLLYNSSYVIIYNININATVNASFIGILIVNVKYQSKIINVNVRLRTFNCSTFNNDLIEINGLRVLVYFYDSISTFGSVTIDNFYYKNYKSCEDHDHLSCVIVTVFLRNGYYNAGNDFRLIILNSAFSTLVNSSVICSYREIEETEETYMAEKSSRHIAIRNCTFSDNTGNPQLNMFNIELINLLP